MEYAFRNTMTRFLLVITVLGLLAGNMWAQGGVGELTGLVTDPSGAVVSNATVTLNNTATGDKRTAVTTPAGVYRFAALPVVGAYTLETSPKGFKSVKVTDVIVSVGTVTSRDIKLELGASSEQVTVEAGQQLVQTEESSVSQLVDRRVWENMPLEARNANDFVNLIAGAVPEQIAGGTFRGAAVNGTRTGTGNFMVEGVDNNEQGQGGVSICGTACGQGGANTSISPDAIQEYRVISHDFNAEYGKAGGFVTDTVLKGGTNQFHGSLFEYNRIQALTANDWFSNNVGARDHLVRNQFGGSIGGPIIKDKTFFFGTVEFHRLRESAPVSATNLTQQFYNFVNTGGLASFYDTNVCGGSCGFTNSVTTGAAFNAQRAKYPLAFPLVNSKINCATDTTGACFTQNFPITAALGLSEQYPVPIYDTATESQVTPINQARFSIKVDHKIGANDQINGVYLFENVDFNCNFCGSDTTFGVPETNPNRAQTAGITWTHTFSPTVLNQAKLGYVRRKADFFAPGTEGIPSQLAALDPTAGGFGASTALPQFFTENEFQYKDDLSITKGKHSLKFGGEYRRTRNGSSFNADQYGHFYSWSAEDLITDGFFGDEFWKGIGYGGYYGGWYQAGAAVNPTNGQVPDFYRGYRANEVGLYGQDDWRVNSRLTVNLGLRWDYFGPPHNFQPNIDSNFYFGNPITPVSTCKVPNSSPSSFTFPCQQLNPFFPGGDPFYANEATAVPQVKNSDIWHKDTNNFAPRVGFAWDTLGNQKWVVRGGFGIFYDRLYNNVFENIRFNPPFYADENFGNFQNGLAGGPTLQPGLFSIPFGPANNAQFISPTLFPAGLPKPVPRHIDQNLVAAYYEQYSFGIQHEISKDFALEANYIGTLGRKLIGILNRNTYDGRTSGVPNAFGVSSSVRPNPIFNSDNARGNFYSSNYNALDLTLRKRFSNGLSFNANYTYAKSLDQLSDVFRSRTAQISATDVENVHYDYGPSDFDVRHRVVVSYNYDLPFFKANRWVGGWALNGIFSWNTGAPVAIFDNNNDVNHDGVFTDRPTYAAGTDVLKSILGKEQAVAGVGNVYQYLDPTQFASTTCPATVNGGFWCNSTLSRNSVPGPKFTNWDFGVSKGFKITENTKLRFDANFFNLFNHPNFQNPQNNFSDPAFGQSQSTYGDTGGHRVTQLALRFDF